MNDDAETGQLSLAEDGYCSRCHYPAQRLPGCHDWWHTGVACRWQRPSFVPGTPPEGWPLTWSTTAFGDSA